MLRLGGLGEPGLSAKIDAGFLVSTVVLQWADSPCFWQQARHDGAAVASLY